MDTNKLSALLFPQGTAAISELEDRYPPRALPEGAAVTRFAPSPTGFVHVGALFPAIVGERLSHSSGGGSILRIEDTDGKRRVDGAAEEILAGLNAYGVSFDEGVCLTEGKISERGAYGPYYQRQRVPLYHACARFLVEQGHAYPCFCSEDKLSAMRQKQESEKANFGYFGPWAACRDLSLPEIGEKLDRGTPYVLRLKSPGRPGQKIVLDDLARGRLELPENDIDHVLLKCDGVPTYHFAHAVDDHFMRVTHVVRGDEWLATYPLHHQLFGLLGFRRPKYVHLAPLMKLEESSRRKLSKRKDPEAALRYYAEKGYPRAALREYIMTLLNSNYEDWRRGHPDDDISAFPFSVKKLGSQGPLFDLDKLHDVCRNTVSRMAAEDIYEQAAEWCRRFCPDFGLVWTRTPEYARRILSIGRGGKKPRRDITLWKDIPSYADFFYADRFVSYAGLPAGLSREDYTAVLSAYRELYDPNDDMQTWFRKIRDMGEGLGFCPDVKAYKNNPSGWKGSVADVSMALRVAVTGREMSPDLHECMRILGKDVVLERIKI